MHLHTRSGRGGERGVGGRQGRARDARHHQQHTRGVRVHCALHFCLCRLHHLAALHSSLCSHPRTSSLSLLHFPFPPLPPSKLGGDRCASPFSGGGGRFPRKTESFEQRATAVADTRRSQIILHPHTDSDSVATIKARAAKKIGIPEAELSALYEWHLVRYALDDGECGDFWPRQLGTRLPSDDLHHRQPGPTPRGMLTVQGSFAHSLFIKHTQRMTLRSSSPA